MRKFSFRLEKLLEFRKMVEKETKEAYLLSRKLKIEADAERDRIAATRMRVLEAAHGGLATRLAALASVDLIDDAERAQESIVGVLETEENFAREVWLNAKKEVNAIEKLRESKHAEWLIESVRFEQKELDEWATSRSKA